MRPVDRKHYMTSADSEKTSPQAPAAAAEKPI
jgi:hypothetical protein